MIKKPIYYKHSGFTLIEIVFAMAVLLIGLVSVLALFPVGLTASKKAGDYTTVAMVAEQVIANIKSAGYNVYPAGSYTLGTQGPPGFTDVDGLDEGTSTLDDLPEGFSWKAVVTNTNVNNLRRVSLLVYWVDQQATDISAFPGYRMENFVTYLTKYD